MTTYQVVDKDGNAITGTTDDESLAHEIAGILIVESNQDVEVVEVEEER